MSLSSCRVIAGTAQNDRYIPARTAPSSGVVYAQKVAVLGQATPTDSKPKIDDLSTRRSKAEKQEKLPYENGLCQALFNTTRGIISTSSILCCSSRPPKPQLPDYRPTVYQPKLTASLPYSSKRRVVNVSSQRTLDLPGITRDFFGQPISCSSKNRLAIALGQKVYTKAIFPQDAVVETVYEHDHRTLGALSWLPGGTKLAVGLSNGQCDLIDCETQKGIQPLVKEKANALSERHVFECVNRDMDCLFVSDLQNRITFIDLRKKTVSATVSALESCKLIRSLSHSPSSPVLAVGTMNDGLHIYDTRNFQETVAKFPHNGTVKAMVWAPWNPQHLFTGGGINDRCIRLFDVARGTLLDQVDTGSQVCTLQASEYYRELVSTHGRDPITFEPVKNNCILWQCATKTKQLSLIPREEFQAHSNYVLFSQLTADQSALITASPDETLHIWNIFEGTKPKKTPAVNSNSLQLKNAPMIR